MGCGTAATRKEQYWVCCVSTAGSVLPPTPHVYTPTSQTPTPTPTPHQPPSPQEPGPGLPHKAAALTSSRTTRSVVNGYLITVCLGGLAASTSSAAVCPVGCWCANFSLSCQSCRVTGVYAPIKRLSSGAGSIMLGLLLAGLLLVLKQAQLLLSCAGRWAVPRARSRLCKCWGCNL
jgi:hypothetical protein